MKIFYIYHSGFAIETENYKLVFDYYMEPKKNSGGFKIGDFLIGEKQVLVFSSHSHGDHFKKEILKWREINPKIKYILSEDIEEKTEAYFVKEGDKLTIDGVKVGVFGSTDLGVSYFVECDEESFFHSGDLNWWSWADDTLEEERYMRELYEEKVALISKDLEEKKVDYLFYPIDPRLEENSFLGIDYFLKRVEVKNIIPMHMWDKYGIASELEKKVPVNIIKIERNCEKIFEE